MPGILQPPTHRSRTPVPPLRAAIGPQHCGLSSVSSARVRRCIRPTRNLGRSPSTVPDWWSTTEVFADDMNEAHPCRFSGRASSCRRPHALQMASHAQATRAASPSCVSPAALRLAQVQRAPPPSARRTGVGCSEAACFWSARSMAGSASSAGSGRRPTLWSGARLAVRRRCSCHAVCRPPYVSRRGHVRPKRLAVAPWGDSGRPLGVPTRRDGLGSAALPDRPGGVPDAARSAVVRSRTGAPAGHVPCGGRSLNIRSSH